MFFSTEVTTTFESITEVIRAYPKWKLKIRGGNERGFFEKAEEGDEDFIKFWDRVQNNPNDTVFYSIDKAVKNIEEKQIVIHLVLFILVMHKIIYCLFGLELFELQFSMYQKLTFYYTQAI